jgi:hypothetical protein
MHNLLIPIPQLPGRFRFRQPLFYEILPFYPRTVKKPVKETVKKR